MLRIGVILLRDSGKFVTEKEFERICGVLDGCLFNIVVAIDDLKESSG